MSKRKWTHPDLPANELKGNSWRTLGEKEGFTAGLDRSGEREFPVTAERMADDEDREMSRRSFVQIMGASTALAGIGLASCRRPESYIVPFANAPEWIIPGKPTHYASSMPMSSGAVPLVVTTYEGRPTKVEPNTLHPDSAGTDAITQASVLNLYSPSRSREPLNKGEKSSMKALQEAFAKATANTAGVAVVIGADESPTRNRLLTEAGVQVFRYEAISGPELSSTSRLVADFEKADRILSFDCDFAGVDSIGPVTPFFDRRKPEGKNYDQKVDSKTLSRLYIAESSFSLTGGMADHRLRLKPSEIISALSFVAKELGISGTGSIDLSEKALKWLKPCVADIKESAGKALIAVGSRHSEAAQRLALAINQKLGNIGEGKPLRSLSRDAVAAGSLSDLCSAIDSGKVETVVFTGPSNPVFDAPSNLEISKKLANVQSFHLGERVDHTAHAATWHIPAAHYLESWSDARSANGFYTLVQPLILPLYDGVSELELLAALIDAKRTFRTGPMQADAAATSYTEVRKTFNALVGSSDKAWKSALKNGFAKEGVSAAAPLTADSGKLAASLGKLKKAAGLEVIFATDYSILDGRYADNGWLQEAPDPISKVTWDNAALISPKTAKDLGVYDKVISLENSLGKSQYPGEVEGANFSAPLVKILLNGTSIEIPVLIAFGQADGVIVLPLGYGQSFDTSMRKADLKSFDQAIHAPDQGFDVGLVSRNAGFNVYPLRHSDTALFTSGATIELTQNNYKMALTQEHHSMYGRALAREVSTIENHGKDFSAQLDNVKKQGMDSHAPENISLYDPMGSTEWWKGGKKKPEPLLNDNVFQWAMAIDLNVCTGCNACLVACQSENNIPIVGKQQVAMGREMHWVRMDRYFAATPVMDDHGHPVMDDHNHPVLDDDEPEMIPQPVGCVQCESAPCETVCPVNATVHTEDGLNAMAYNRCIGTRYCANNCPYKARRFNFFDYNKRNPLLEKNLYKGPLGEKMEGDAKHLQKNPNVTVRMRGVMEKCTYCVQRLKSARIKAKSVRKSKSMVATSTGVEVKPEELRAPADSVKVACQEACPSGAITFGNLLMKDKETVVRAKDSKRNYDLLHYIGTRPRTSYLARVKNPNPKMPGATGIGTATIHMH